MCQLQLGQRSRISPWVSRSARARTICSPVQNGVSPADGSWEGGSTWGSRSLERGGNSGDGAGRGDIEPAGFHSTGQQQRARAYINSFPRCHTTRTVPASGQYYSAAPATTGRFHATRADAVPGGGARAVQCSTCRRVAGRSKGRSRSACSANERP